MLRYLAIIIVLISFSCTSLADSPNEVLETEIIHPLEAVDSTPTTRPDPGTVFTPTLVSIYAPIAARNHSIVPTPDTILINPGFEGGQWNEAVYWEWPWHEAYFETFSEVRPPVGWVAWWVENEFCQHAEQFKTGRPEFTLIFDYEDPARVYEGDQAAKVFTFWRCGHFGLYQKVNLSPGQYTFGMQIHTWYTSCSEDRHGSIPKDQNCDPIYNEHMYFRVGVDPLGTEPESLSITEDASGMYYFSSVAWGPWHEQYGLYNDRIWTPVINLVRATDVTIWVEAVSELPLKHDDLYVDDVQWAGDVP